MICSTFFPSSFPQTDLPSLRWTLCWTPRQRVAVVHGAAQPLQAAPHGAHEATPEKLRQVTGRQETQGGNAKAVETQGRWPQDFRKTIGKST